MQKGGCGYRALSQVKRKSEPLDLDNYMFVYWLQIWRYIKSTVFLLKMCSKTYGIVLGFHWSYKILSNVSEDPVAVCMIVSDTKVLW